MPKEKRDARRNEAKRAKRAEAKHREAAVAREAAERTAAVVEVVARHSRLQRKRLCSNNRRYACSNLLSTLWLALEQTFVFPMAKGRTWTTSTRCIKELL